MNLNKKIEFISLLSLQLRPYFPTVLKPGKNFLWGTDLFPDPSEWKITNNLMELDDFFGLNLPPATGSPKPVRPNGDNDQNLKELNEFRRSFASPNNQNIVYWKEFFAETARRNIHLMIACFTL